MPSPPSTPSSSGQPSSSSPSASQPASSSAGTPGTPDWTPPGQDSSAADAETLQRASEQLAGASEAVAAAREDLADAARQSGEPGAEARAAEEALQGAEAALGEASERLAEAAAGGGDPGELNEAVSAAEEALAAAEEALAAAGEAGAQAGGEPADAAGAAGAEETLAGAEAAQSGGGEDLPAAEDSQSSGTGGPPTIVVAVAGAQGSLDQAQGAIAEAVRALIITGVYLPPGGAEGDAEGLPPGGMIILMPGEPGANEKVAELEGELEGTLVVFDGRLLEERNRLASQRSGTGTGLPGGGEEVLDPGSEAEALLEELGEGGPGSDGEVPDQPVKGGEVASVEDMGQGKKTTNTVRPSDIPDGVPDGADDDIVARQIREAAMSETDPVLREKLWREYINYKKGGG